MDSLDKAVVVCLVRQMEYDDAMKELEERIKEEQDENTDN